MAAPAPVTADDVLARLAPLLTAVYEDDQPYVMAREPRGQHAIDTAARYSPAYLNRAREIRRLIGECRRLRITPRQVASHTRLPGSWVLRWWPYPEEVTQAWQAEVHHLERQLAAVRLQRAQYARFLVSDRRAGYVPDPDLVRSPLNPEGKPPTKTQVADWFGVSRPTLDEWIADASRV